jgi:hypothetical protein
MAMGYGGCGARGWRRLRLWMAAHNASGWTRRRWWIGRQPLSMEATTLGALVDGIHGGGWGPPTTLGEEVVARVEAAISMGRLGQQCEWMLGSGCKRVDRGSGGSGSRVEREGGSGVSSWRG